VVTDAINYGQSKMDHLNKRERNALEVKKDREE